MKKFSVFLGLFCLASTVLIAQSQAIRAFHKGTIFTEDGETIEAYIRYDFNSPSEVQKEVRYTTEAGWQAAQAKGRVKGRDMEKLRVTKVLRVELDNGRIWERITYANLSADRALDMLPSDYLFELLYDGPTKVYRRARVFELEKTNTFLPAHEWNRMSYWERSEWIGKRFYELIIVLPDGKARGADVLAIPALFSDYEEIVKRYNEDRYARLLPKFNSAARTGYEDHTYYYEGFMQLAQDFAELYPAE